MWLKSFWRCYMGADFSPVCALPRIGKAVLTPSQNLLPLQQLMLDHPVNLIHIFWIYKFSIFKLK